MSRSIDQVIADMRAVQYRNNAFSATCKQWADALEAAQQAQGVDLREWMQHKVTCRREITRQADDSAAYLSENCTCGLSAALEKGTEKIAR